ncbi:MAG: helix-turn-helix domain-containing protein, partial [Nanoarchaeota archaeon]
EKIKEKYLLIEKTFNLNSYESKEDAIMKTKNYDVINSFIENIVNITCGYFKLNKERLLNGRRVSGEYINASYMVAYLCRGLPENPITMITIGMYFKKDHSSIKHWLLMAEKKMQNSFEFKYDINQIQKLVENSLKTY